MFLRLVEFQDYCFETVQGEGVLVGTPSIFVRCHGCGDSCSWCDTPGSWKPGSKYREVSVDGVAEEVRKFGSRHVVLTGGNPFLQSDALLELVQRLGTWYHFTIETQASVFDPELASHCDLLSLSPKLHNWPEGRQLKDFFMNAVQYRNDVQVKIVVTNNSDVVNALGRFQEFVDWHVSTYRGREVKRPTYILQPESSGGRILRDMVYTQVYEWMKTTLTRFDVRVIPQLHKVSLTVL